jgi:hypothetical protein
MEVPGLAAGELIPVEGVVDVDERTPSSAAASAIARLRLTARALR